MSKVLDWGDWGAAQAKLKRVMLRYERMQAAKAIGTHTPEEWKLLHDVFGRCLACGVGCDELIGGTTTKDHILPVALGGCDCIANLQPICRRCNSRGVGEDLREQALPGWQTIYLHRLGAYY